MRHIILGALMAASLIPGVASAQSAAELRHDQREIHRDRAEIRQDMARGDYREAHRDMRELNRDRREMREDWRDYREAHRDLYRAPRWDAPRGYGWRPVREGYRFDPAFYHRRYWINDPWRYRLPPVHGYERWVRYGRDVVLIDTRSGVTLRVYSGFFW